MARVCGVMAARTAAGSMFRVSGSTSTSTGRALRFAAFGLRAGRDPVRAQRVDDLPDLFFPDDRGREGQELGTAGGSAGQRHGRASAVQAVADVGAPSAPAVPAYAGRSGERE